MALRKFSIIKILALLLFSFELLAPVYLSSRIEGSEQESNAIQVHTPTSLSVFSSLLYEEAGNEEGREGKEGQKVFQLVTDINIGGVFDFLVQSERTLTIVSHRQILPVRVSLNTLYSVFRI